MSETRLQQIADWTREAGLDALAMIPSPNFIWATGLKKHLMERPTVLIVRNDGVTALVAAGFEMESVARIAPDLQRFPFADNPKRWHESFEAASRSLGLSGRTIGVEPQHFRFHEGEFLRHSADGIRLVGAPELFASFRLRKNTDDLKKMRKAAQIAEAALEDTLPLIRPGIRELEIANALIANLIRRGSDYELPFDPIIGSGPNSADPHAAVSEREVCAGDFVLIDWGARYQGYCSDLTRTFAVGEISDKQREVYETVHAANRAAFNGAKPGMRAGDVDGLARDVIRAAGYGDFFTHRLGHGLGMECHEDPYMFAENDLILESGMVFTDEPGIYLAGEFGVRIEDDLVVTETGCDSLTSFPRELRTLGDAE